MSVAAAVPHSQSALPPSADAATLAWARSAAFVSPQAPVALAASSSQTHPALAAPCATTPPLPPLTAQLPGVYQDAPCNGVVHGCGFDSESDRLHPDACPLHQQSQSSWVQSVDLIAAGHSERTCGGDCHCGGGCSPPAAGGGPGGGDDDEGYSSGADQGSDGLVVRRQAHLHASTSRATAVASAVVVTVAAAMSSSSGGGSQPPPTPQPGRDPVEVSFGPTLSSELQGCPASPQPPIPLCGARASGSGRVSGGGGGAAAAAAAPRRPAYGVKASAMTSQISAAQRNRAAAVIQAAWRGFRIRRLYLRLIVWRLRPPTRQQQQQQESNSGIREFPPIPDLPAVSLFTQHGRPGRFRSVKRRVWFDMEGPFFPSPSSSATTTTATTTAAAAAAVATATTPANAAATTAFAADALAPEPALLKPQAAPPQAAAPPPPPQSQQPQQPQPRRGPPVPLRLLVPPRAEADVPMSEVERILAGGFWRVEEPAAGGSTAAGGGGDGGDGAGGGAGEQGLSLYMRAKMRQEEREAEEALQMLSYEPHDLKHILGSLKERTLERLGSLGRTIGETLSSGLHLNLNMNMNLGRSLPLGGWASRGGCGGHGQAQGPGFGHRHWPGGGGGGGGGGQQAHGGQQARSLPRAGRWGAAAGGGRPRLQLYCAAPAPSVTSTSTAPTGSCGAGEWSLRVPLLTVVDPEGHSHTTEVEPSGVAIPVPIAVNWQRYRSRSHVSRMSF
ncbi:hypothetical protein PLESTB_000454700 [Pleodorina starrii]|uniref:Uncharacterized protein n=1 Tax=Pleodorina starrii TaxID=330485 RepID=A0A9W6BEZ6_9CHLO|nr:hypothetical protein PLESTM_000756100 [Pleodorina starrii]GLC50996.1 hypothetical protein PLESTB_000454700 [Pleodorina starrii]